MSSFEQQLETIGEIGFVDHIYQSIVYVSGLPSALPNEIILFESGETGLVTSLHKEYAEIMVFSKKEVAIGTRATRTNKFLQVGVGDYLLGQSINAFGYPLTPQKPFPKEGQTREIDIVPLGISARRKIAKPLETGYTIVDLLIPLGKGQRELVLGDRKTGKTNFLLATIRAQAKLGSVCIYTAVGKKKFDIKKIEAYFKRHKVDAQTILIASNLEDSIGEIYLTPFTAMTVAEYFRDKGQDVLLVVDDLYTHAKFYRELALLAKRFPGRNSYPADIFYTHARLLERAGNFILPNGNQSSISCIPVAETQSGDLSGYIQTNLMSMTDGHIYFDKDLFNQGRRPAINPFLSVSRVGRQTQSDLGRDINRELITFFTLYERMQRYIHFGAESNQAIKNTIITGEKILAYFDKMAYYIVPVDLQIFIFCLIWIGIWQATETLVMKADFEKLINLYHTNQTIMQKIQTIVQSSKSFNTLLSTIRLEQDALLAQLGLRPNYAATSKSQAQTQTAPGQTKQT